MSLQRVQDIFTSISVEPTPHFLVRHSWVVNFKPNQGVFTGDAYFVAKRSMDILLVLLSSPLWVLAVGLVGLAIKHEDRSEGVIFVQERTGRGGKRFPMYKFRTMVANAEEQKEELMHLNELQWPDFKITDDPRITRVGRFLRKTSLDELPQVFNVLRGEMSLVGPRPTSFKSETYDLWQTERLDVLPGITGLWQLLGRAETEFNERLRMDIAYIERRCLWFDIQILTRTLLAVLKQRGAY